MSFSNTYVHNILIGLDDFGAALLFNRTDCTISTMCRIVQLANTKAAGGAWALGALKLHKWQLVFLNWLAPFLDDLQTNHCALALQGDLQRANSTQSLLNAISQPKAS